MKQDIVKRILGMTMALTLGLSLAGCGNTGSVPADDAGSQNTGSEVEVTSEENADSRTSDAQASEDTTEEEVSDKITDDDVYAAISEYVLDEFGQYYDASDVSIPDLYIMEIDYSDENDIKVYGDFWFYTYKINGNTLETQAGGSYPGCMHLSKSADGLAVTRSEIVEDGSNWNDSAKEIFGDRYEAFIAGMDDNESREKERADQIAAYVKENGLEVTQYQDYGWDPVTF